MVYYHCSPQAGIKTLEPRISHLFDNQKVVYMTTSLPMALMYAIRHYEYTYGYHWQDGKPVAIYYEEYYPGALKSLYDEKAAWLYTCAAGDYQATNKPNEWISFSPVPVIDAFYISDALKALLEQEKTGQLQITYYHQMSEESLAWVRRMEKDTILKHGLLDKGDSFARFMKEKYPLSWADALAERDDIK